MADQPTTEDRISILERVIFALLTQGIAPSSQAYKTLRGILVDHPQSSYLLPNREIESDNLVKWFRSATEGSAHISDLIEKLTSAQAEFRRRLRQLETAQEGEANARLQLLDRLQGVERELHESWRNYIELLVVLSESESLQGERFRRILPASVYLSSDTPELGRKLAASLDDLGRKLGFEVLREEDAQRGSWWKRTYQRAVKAMTRPEIQHRLRQAERALEMKHIDKVQSEIDLNVASAAANKEALDDVDHGIIALGSLFGVKTVIDGKPRLAIVSLTQEQMQKVRANPELQMDPLKFFKTFASSKQSTMSDRSSSTRVAGRKPAAIVGVKNKRSKKPPRYAEKQEIPFANEEKDDAGEAAPPLALPTPTSQKNPGTENT
jgi:hypothetical protein